jgi:hypothetical protein
MNRNIESLSLDQLLRDSAWVRRLAVQLVNDDASEDLVQDTWIAASSTPSQRRALDPRAWVVGVMRNLGRMQMRTNSRRKQREAEWALETFKNAIEEEIAVADSFLARGVSRDALYNQIVTNGKDSLPKIRSRRYPFRKGEEPLMMRLSLRELWHRGFLTLQIDQKPSPADLARWLDRCHANRRAWHSRAPTVSTG